MRRPPHPCMRSCYTLRSVRATARSQRRRLSGVRSHARCAHPTLVSRRSPHEVRRFSRECVRDVGGQTSMRRSLCAKVPMVTRICHPVCKIPKLLGWFQAWERALCQARWADFTVHCGPPRQKRGPTRPRCCVHTGPVSGVGAGLGVTGRGSWVWSGMRSDSATTITSCDALHGRGGAAPCKFSH